MGIKICSAYVMGALMGGSSATQISSSETFLHDGKLRYFLSVFDKSFCFNLR